MKSKRPLKSKRTSKKRSGKRRHGNCKRRSVRKRSSKLTFDGMKRGADEEAVATLKKQRPLPGLLIKDTLISKISGPVAISILQPTKEFHKSHKAPIFILFGDQHYSRRNLCEPCECDEVTDCCYPVYSHKFLKLIDEVAKDHVVHFSVEDDLNDSDINGIIDDKSEEPFFSYGPAHTPLEELLVPLQPCYSRTLKEKDTELYNSRCPTQHILWHKANIREFSNSVYKVINLFIDLIDEINYEAFCSVLEEIKKNPFHPILKHAVKPNFETVLLIATHIDGKTANPILKQIQKMPDKQKEQWLVYYDKYYEFAAPSLHTLQDVEDIFNMLNKLVQNEWDDYEIAVAFDILKYNIYKAKKLAQYFIDYNSVALDLYFLTRSFKRTEETKNPLISIGYFGNRHIQYLNDFLILFMGYSMTFYSNEENEDNKKKSDRCQKITQRVDLNAMISELTS